LSTYNVLKKDECKDIWVYAEVFHGVLTEPTFEIINKSYEIKEKLGGTDTITAVLLGSDVEKFAPALFEGGAEKVIVVDHPNLKDYSARPYADVLTELCKKYKPSIFMLTASANGVDLAPRVMARLGTGLTADCVDLGVNEDGIFVQTKPSYGGDILSHIAILETRPQMVTVRGGSFECREKKPGATGELIVEKMDVKADDAYKLVSVEPKVSDCKSISDAEILVAAGRGVKNESELEIFEELANLLGGELGVTRPLVDNNWRPKERQIGQSGTIVKPNFLLNVGISGAAQYTMGMEKSKLVMTINYNENAQLFDYSHYGIVADYKTIIPALIEELKKRC
jgi:electron transfer flavoprotein alpha subunit